MLFKDEFQSIQSLIPQASLKNSKVSKSGVGWHLDHMLKSIIVTCKSVKRSNPDDYKWKFNLLRTYVFLMNSFPRGSAKAPKLVVSVGEIEESELYSQLNLAKSLVNEMRSLDTKSNFQHPYFGIINLKETQKFLRIHTNHHLKIISDILKK